MTGSTKPQRCHLLSALAASQSHIPPPTALSSPSAITPQWPFPSVLLFHGLWPPAKVIQTVVEVGRGRSCAPRTCCWLWERHYIPLLSGGRTTIIIIIINNTVIIINNENVKNPTTFSLRFFIYLLIFPFNSHCRKKGFHQVVLGAHFCPSQWGSQSCSEGP